MKCIPDYIKDSYKQQDEDIVRACWRHQDNTRFKSSSAILNTLLRIMNEKTFENGEGPKKVPLLLCLASSNEWPGGENGTKELEAVFDRFLFRKTVNYISAPLNVSRLLWERDHTPVFSTHIRREEVEQAKEESQKLLWSDEAKEALETILRDLNKEGIFPGDRRQYKAVSACQAMAWLEGVEEVTPEQLEVLCHVLWCDPLEQPRKVAEVIRKVANPTNMQVNSLILECQELLKNVNYKETKTLTSAVTKMKHIEKSLRALRKSPKALTALEYVEKEGKKMRTAFIDNSMEA